MYHFVSIHKFTTSQLGKQFCLICAAVFVISLQSGCVFIGQRGTMLKWRVGWNEHQRPAVICERTEARPPKRERVNHYRWLHGELLVNSTPVSHSSLTPDIPATSGQSVPSYVDPFVNNAPANSLTTPDTLAPPVLPHDLAPVREPVPPDAVLPPPIWTQPDTVIPPVAPPVAPAPAMPDTAPDVIKKEDAGQIASAKRFFFQPASYKR